MVKHIQTIFVGLALKGLTHFRLVFQFYFQEQLLTHVKPVFQFISMFFKSLGKVGIDLKFYCQLVCSMFLKCYPTIVTSYNIGFQSVLSPSIFVMRQNS